MNQKKIRVRYYARLREEASLAEETVMTSVMTVSELWAEVAARHRFTLDVKLIRAAVNDEFQPWEQVLSDNDFVVFMPPVAGG